MNHSKFRPIPTFVALGVALSGCGSTTECGAGTVAKFNMTTGNTDCVADTVVAGACDPATATLMGGECVADPSKFPTCGPGTMLDKASNQCVPTGMSGTPTPKPCDATQPAGGFCVNGTIQLLVDNTFATGIPLEVRAYDPIMFLTQGPATLPQKTVMTSDATFVLNGLVDSSGMGLIAIAVTDPKGPSSYALVGSGLNNVAAGGKYSLGLFALTKDLLGKWDTAAGLSGMNTFEAKGAYIARFLDAPIAMESMAHPVAGVTLVANGMAAPSQFFFKGDMKTISTTAMATDDMTGTVIQAVPNSDIKNYTGTGGTIKFETALGASLPGIVFVQKFHPMTM